MLHPFSKNCAFTNFSKHQIVAHENKERGNEAERDGGSGANSTKKKFKHNVSLSTLGLGMTFIIFFYFILFFSHNFFTPCLG